MPVGFIILFAWLALAIVIMALGWTTGAKPLVTIGAVMLLLMVAIAEVN